MRRVLGAAAARRAGRGDPAAPPARADSVRRTQFRVRGGRASAAARARRARPARARHLLRDAAARAGAGRPGRGSRGRRVRPLPADRRGARTLAGWDAGAADVLDVSPRHRVRASTGVRRARLLDRLGGGRVRVGGARRLRNPVPPRGGPHPLRPAGPDELPRGRLRLPARVERELGDRRADRADPGPGRRRPGDLRPLGRRRLERRRAARPQGDRRPAHVRVRRPRADAPERGRAGDRGLPRPLPGAARRRRRRPSASWRA